MISEVGKIIIAGFTSEIIDGVKTIKSVFLLNPKNGRCGEVPISKDYEIDQEKLAKEIFKYYRKEVIAIIDLEFKDYRPDVNFVDLRFVVVKN